MIKKHKRKIVIIKGSFQLRLAILAFFSCLIATVIIGIDIYVNINKMLASFNLDPEFVRTFTKISNLLFIIMLVYTVIIVASSFFFSHTIAGPIYRFEKSFEEVQNGNLTIRVKLRKGDAFPELQEKFNLMLDSIQSKLIKVDRLLAELEMSGQAHKAKENREEINKQFILNPPKFR